MLSKHAAPVELESTHQALEQGQFELAYTALETAARRPLKPATQALYLLYLAEVYALQGAKGIDDGFLTLRSAVSTDPQLAEHPLYAALYWEFSARRGKTASEVKQGIKGVLNAKDPLARFHAAKALTIVKAKKSAAKVLEQIEDLALPTYLEWRRWSLLGRCYQQQGKWENACAAFRRAVQASSGVDQQNQRLQLAGCLLELGEPESVLHVLGSIDVASLNRQQEVTVFCLRGRAQLAMDNPNAALFLFQRARAIELEAYGELRSFMLAFALGQCLTTLGRFVEAAIALKDAVACAPSEVKPYAQHEYAFALAESGDLQGAESYLEAVLHHSSYCYRAQVFVDLAELSLRQGDLKQAEGYGLRALELGAVAEACLCLGTIAFDSFRFEDARGWFERAIHACEEGEPYWTLGHQMLADLFAQQGQGSASRLLFHAQAALSYTPPESDWYLPLTNHRTAAMEYLEDGGRFLN
jgi:tetratricopeptide (TPR) repeat protein